MTHNELLKEIAEELLDNGYSLEDIANFGKDLPGEAESIAENRAEAAWEAYCERGRCDGYDYRNSLRQAGRGHLLGD